MMMLKKLTLPIFTFLFCLVLCSFKDISHPFNYDLHLTKIEGEKKGTFVCFHGMGGDYTLAEFLKKTSPIQETLVSFNFPDHNLFVLMFDPHKTTFGTIHELLPAIYTLKKCIEEDGLDSINLYGFSAGGGAIINVLTVLNTDLYDKELKKIGVSTQDKKTLLSAIQKGCIILDAPLKSLREIVSFRPSYRLLGVIAKRYEENKMEPIDNLEHLQNLSLHIILQLQNPDDILSNRDDDLYIEKLKKYNAKGNTTVIVCDDGGHNLPHPTVWNAYLQSISE